MSAIAIPLRSEAKPKSRPAGPRSNAKSIEQSQSSPGFAIPAAQLDGLHERLLRAAAVVKMLVHVFGGDSVPEIPCKVEGLMGCLQHADFLLTGLHLEITEIDDPVPEDLRLRTFEAHSLIAMLEALQFSGGGEWRFCDSWSCSYLDSAHQCLELAQASLALVKGSGRSL